jgi:coatomer subunit zeta
VTAVLLIDSDGNRLVAKYYQPAHQDPKNPTLFKHPFQSLKEQRQFENTIWDKTRRANGQSCLSAACSRVLAFSVAHPLYLDLPTTLGDILLYNNQLVLYKASIDLTFYVVGPEGENELMLLAVLNAFYDAVSLLLRHQVEKRAILENLDLVVLALDETIDNGSVLSLSLSLSLALESPEGCFTRLSLS